MAELFKTSTDRPEVCIQKADATTAKLRDADYSKPRATAYCAGCHRLDGCGALRVFPALAHNSMVFADDPSSHIQVALADGAMPSTPHDKMAFVMAGFQRLGNRKVAETLNFIRNGWGNHGSEILASDVARVRRLVDRRLVHYYAPAAKK